MKRDQFAVQSISGREREILLSLLEGCTNQEIATSLGICQKTVEEHLTRIYKKIGGEDKNSSCIMVGFTK